MKPLLKHLHLFWLHLRARWVIFRWNRQLIDIYSYPTDEALQWIAQMRWFACSKEQGVIANAILESLQNLENAVKRKAALNA